MADVRAKSEVEGTVAEGSAVAGNPVAIGLDDGTNVVRAQATAGGDLKVTLDSETVAISAVTPGVGATDLGKADSAPHTDRKDGRTETDRDSLVRRRDVHARSTRGPE